MKECTTHHNACDCREESFRKLSQAAVQAVTAWNNRRDMSGPIHRIELALSAPSEQSDDVYVCQRHRKQNCFDCQYKNDTLEIAGLADVADAEDECAPKAVEIEGVLVGPYPKPAPAQDEGAR